MALPDQPKSPQSVLGLSWGPVGHVGNTFPHPPVSKGAPSSLPEFMTLGLVKPGSSLLPLTVHQQHNCRLHHSLAGEQDLPNPPREAGLPTNLKRTTPLFQGVRVLILSQIASHSEIRWLPPALGYAERKEDEQISPAEVQLIQGDLPSPICAPSP